jgi:hypothetical protein
MKALSRSSAAHNRCASTNVLSVPYGRWGLTSSRIGEYAFYPVARDRPQDDSLSIPIVLFLHTLSKVV